MSRSTQYIGLNDYAREYVASAIKDEVYEMTTGMFEESVYGHIYTLPANENGNVIEAREVVDIVPWSSGPMVFTYLQLTLVRPNGGREEFGHAYKWMLDPMLKGEYDAATGRWYV